MDSKTKKILIGSATALVLAGGIILTVHLSRKRKVRKECEKAGGEYDKKLKRCLTESGATVVIDSQTQDDIGRTVNTHPKLKYTNVRTAPTVDEGYLGGYLFGLGDNMIGKVTKNPVGKIIKAEKGDDDYTWYKIKLSRSIEGKDTGYVREDAISFT